MHNVKLFTSICRLSRPQFKKYVYANSTTGDQSKRVHVRVTWVVSNQLHQSKRNSTFLLNQILGTELFIDKDQLK